MKIRTQIELISLPIYNYFSSFQNKEAVAQMCSVKKVFLEISQNSQENTFFTEHLRTTPSENKKRDSNGNFLIPNHKLCFAVVSSLDYSSLLQNQPPRVFCKKRCSQKFCKFHGNTQVLVLFLIKLQDLQTTAFVSYEFFLFNFEL